MDWGVLNQHAYSYRAFLDRYGTPTHRERWQAIYERVTLTETQRALLAGFVREMHLLCLAGTWCGDCVLQGPVLQRLAEASSRIELRFLDRDDHAEVQQALTLNGGGRVPVVVLLSEDFQECGRYGDRTIAAYRKMAHEHLGPACPTGVLPPGPDHLGEVTADWLRELERTQLMLRLSPRLRALHGD